MAWIKFDKDVPSDPRLLSAAEKLWLRYTISIESSRGGPVSSGFDLDDNEALAFMRNAVTGALVALWVYADTHIRNGDVLPISVTALDNLVGMQGFCEAIGEDWVRPSEDGSHVVLPGYCEKNGLIAKEKRKSANAERQRRFRERHNARSNASRNAVSNTDVTRLDRDQDLNQDVTPEVGARAKARFPDDPVNGNAVAYIPLNDDTEFGVSKEYAEELARLYPAVDVPQTLNEIRGYNVANQHRRKTRRGILAHINTWMAKEQNRGAKA